MLLDIIKELAKKFRAMQSKQKGTIPALYQWSWFSTCNNVFNLGEHSKQRLFFNKTWKTYKIDHLQSAMCKQRLTLQIYLVMWILELGTVVVFCKGVTQQFSIFLISWHTWQDTKIIQTNLFFYICQGTLHCCWGEALIP